MNCFSDDIIEFNKMYKLPVATKPSLDQLGTTPLDRLKNFKNILAEELDEIDIILKELEYQQNPDASDRMNAMVLSDIEILTSLADLLGDIQVYCASEMTKFGLPVDKVLEIIMKSNFSKMGADGKPIYDERGKLQKGPNYWKQEPKLQAMLTTLTLGPGHVAAQEILDASNRILETTKNTIGLGS